MINSKIGICNLALAAIGEDSIRDFDEGNKRARMCDVFYEQMLNYLLGQFDWPFARSRKALQQLAEPSNWVPDGVYAYAMPSDCHVPLDIYPEGNRQEWEVMGDELYSEIDTTEGEDVELVLIYTRREVNPTKFSTEFSNLLGLGLAIRICPPMTGDKELTKALAAEFKVAKMDAWGTDANVGNKFLHSDDDPNLDPFVDADYAFRSGIL